VKHFTDLIQPKISKIRHSPVSSEISDFMPCANAQNNILLIKYAEKTDDEGLAFGV